MVWITEALCNIVVFALCLFLLRGFFPVQWPPSARSVAVIIGVWLLFLLSAFLLESSLWSVAILFFVAGFLCWYMGQTGIRNAALFGLLLSVLRLVSIGGAILLSQLFPKTFPESAALSETVILYALSGAMAVISPRWRTSSTPLLRLIPVWLVAVIMCWEAGRHRSMDTGFGMDILCLLWLSYCGLLLFPVGDKLDTKARAYLEQQQKHHHFALQEEYYHQLQEKQTETRALWHDLNKYLRAAKAEAPSAQALQQLESMLDSATEIIEVGNPVLNVILNEYSQIAKASGIDLRMKAQVPEILSVSVADLYILIGNTMDNALEACQGLPKEQRLIDLTLRTHNGVLYYKLVNPYDIVISRQKKDPMRGYGLKNVRHCVEQYGGVMDWTEENGFFTVTAHLNLPD